MFARSISIKVNFVVNANNLEKVSRGIHKLKMGMVSFQGSAIRALSSFARGMQLAVVATGRFAARVWRDLTNVEMLMNRLRASVDGLVNAFRKSFIIVMSLYALGRGLGSFIAAAGAIEENLNAMSISFERNKDAVLDWADGYAKATGRSRYEIREMATQFALIMKGQIDDENTVAKLSMGLTERALDMQSALQEAAGSSADVSRAIISALTGETEQIKRWGVDVRVDALKRYAKEMGLNYAAMSEAEKIEIRYQKILRDTNYLIGDAIRTKREYTNTIKNMWGVLSDFRRVIGMGILKPILKVTNVFIDNIAKLNEWLEVGSRVQAMFGTIGFVIVAALTKAGIVFAPLFIRFAILATLVQAVWIVLEDFFAWLNGEDRKTFFGKFFKDLGIARGEVKELATSMMDLAVATIMFVGAIAKLYLIIGRGIGETFAKAVLRDEAEAGQIKFNKQLRAQFYEKQKAGTWSSPNEKAFTEKMIRKTDYFTGSTTTNEIIANVDARFEVETKQELAEAASKEVYDTVMGTTGYLHVGGGAGTKPFTELELAGAKD